MANGFSLKNNLLLICGHYKGIDQRFRDHFVTREISIGDYVLSGGEIAAAVLVDAIGRLIPGVLNDETSALTDSFQDNLLAPPVYTRPEEFRGWKVPDILLSGNHKLIEEWRVEQSFTNVLRKEGRIYWIKNNAELKAPHYFINLIFFTLSLIQLPVMLFLLSKHLILPGHLPLFSLT